MTTETPIRPTSRNDLPNADLVAWLGQQTWSTFATDLARAHARYGRLTERQEAAARRMHAKCVARDAARANRPQRTERAASGLNLRALFENADGSRRLNSNGNPVTTLLVGIPNGDTRLKLKIDYPTTGRWAGWVFVKDAAEYGHGRRYGKQAPGVGVTYVGDVVEDLVRVITDLQGALARYGALTNRCGVCNRPLEDKTSVARGIGPVCFGIIGGTDDHVHVDGVDYADLTTGEDR